MSAQVIDVAQLGALTKIGQGGQGVVYRCPQGRTAFAPTIVYKKYRDRTAEDIDFDALAAMPGLLSEQMSNSEAQELISRAAWPCAVVETEGKPSGFVMPAIPDRFFTPLSTVAGVQKVPAEFQHLLNDADVLKARGVDVDDRRRLTLLYEVASGLEFLHQHGICVGDLSPKNLLFSSALHDDIYFLDCDTMRVNGVSALPQVETPGWEVPVGEELATVASDTYKLGLLALRLLVGDQDVSDPQRLPTSAPAALRRIITDSLDTQPQRRPVLAAWKYILEGAAGDLQQQKLQTPHTTADPTPPRSSDEPQLRSRPTLPSQQPYTAAAPTVSAPAAHPGVNRPPVPQHGASPPRTAAIGVNSPAKSSGERGALAIAGLVALVLSIYLGGQVGGAGGATLVIFGIVVARFAYQSARR
ncbi:MAG TPA: hypothetical protein PLD01_11425 [Mycobacterium sp.]|nr:hypothetical protein [Mycobacterium sp.]